jgi:hypothetical protein
MPQTIALLLILGLIFTILVDQSPMRTDTDAR